MSDFGAGFRKAREALGISLNDIATETRIGTRFLQAIESEEFHRLPGGVFNRGFIRSYAERLGLDPDIALADYDRLVRPSEAEAVLGAAQRQRTRADFALYPIAIGALLLLIVAFYALNQNTENGETNVVQPDPPAPASAPPPIISAEPAVEVVEAAPEPAVTPTPAAPVQQQLVVEMTASEETWIRVLTDGSAPAEEILQPGTTRRFTAQSSLALTVGNAAGVVLRVNDRQVQSLGRQGQVRSFVLTPASVNDIDRIIADR